MLKIAATATTIYGIKKEFELTPLQALFKNSPFGIFRMRSSRIISVVLCTFCFLLAGCFTPGKRDIDPFPAEGKNTIGISISITPYKDKHDNAHSKAQIDREAAEVTKRFAKEISPLLKSKGFEPILISPQLAANYESERLKQWTEQMKIQGIRTPFEYSPEYKQFVQASILPTLKGGIWSGVILFEGSYSRTKGGHNYVTRTTTTYSTAVPGLWMHMYMIDRDGRYLGWKMPNKNIIGIKQRERESFFTNKTPYSERDFDGWMKNVAQDFAEYIPPPKNHNELK